MPDSADFDRRQVDAMYGGYLRCFQTNKWGAEKHHILGRGGKRYRRIMSSLLNLALLDDAVHDGPLTSSPDQARVYLRKAFENFSNAVAQGKIEIREKDKEFMVYADDYLRRFNLPPLYR